eukprot:g2565.t1
MSSWDDYINEIVKDGFVEQAAIIGRDDLSVWASTPDFVPRAPYQIDEKTIDEQCPRRGEYFARASQKSTGFKGGLILFPLKTAILVATYDEGKGQQAGNCNMKIAEIGAYLEENDI